MTSKRRYEAAYVWIHLPGASKPVVAGRLVPENNQLIFNYGQSYLARPDAIPVYDPELPLESGVIDPKPDFVMAQCLRDAAPDAWGRRVIIHNLFGADDRDAGIDVLDELMFLLESGSDRFGALDFQQSSTDYVPRMLPSATLEELSYFADLIDSGASLPPELAQALSPGSSMGGARPKATLEDGGHKYIAKFSSSKDIYNVVKFEFVAMRLAALAGLSVAPVRLERVAGKDVLMVERFDRVKEENGWQRKAAVSALTLLELDEMTARYASYEDLAVIIRHRFSAPQATLHELFKRLVFNVLCGNTDDHARNHAAFWDGKQLSLTPAYDICPQSRMGNEASQAMRIIGDSQMSRLETCLQVAPCFSLNTQTAKEMIENQIRTVCLAWSDVCAEADLAVAEQNMLRHRMFFNPFIFEGAPESLRQAASKIS